MGKVPKTETEIYMHFTRFTLMRNLSKSGDIDVNEHRTRQLNWRRKKTFAISKSVTGF